MDITLLVHERIFWMYAALIVFVFLIGCVSVEDPIVLGLWSISLLILLPTVYYLLNCREIVEYIVLWIIILLLLIFSLIWIVDPTTRLLTGVFMIFGALALCTIFYSEDAYIGMLLSFSFLIVWIFMTVIANAQS